jgi:transposase InsO family protein
MKSNFPRIRLAKLCGWFGITRQAYYQNSWKGIEISIEEDLILKEVLGIRKNHKRMGTRKLYDKLHPFMLEHQIKMGRDALFDLLSSNHLLVRKRKRRIQTTQSFHWLRKYPNLIREFIPTGPNQLWVSDITYWKINGGHVYISFITDAYSHKVVGFHVAQTLEAVESVQALKMALSGLFMEPDGHFQLIHHSDRGVQYCSYEYVKLLQDKNIKISMTENGDPLENALAERLNGILKDEYLIDNPVTSIEEARKVLTRSVSLYNEDRPHMSIGNQYPAVVHEQKIQTERLWKNYYKKNPTIVNQYQD